MEVGFRWNYPLNKSFEVIEGSEIIYRNYVDISIAVATPRGLVVPVLRNVESMSYSGIEKMLGELGVKVCFIKKKHTFNNNF